MWKPVIITIHADSLYQNAVPMIVFNI